VETNVEYTKKWGSVRAGVTGSVFDNEVQTLLWDNPYRITDQTYHLPAGAYSNGNGSVRGRLALPPSNSAYSFHLNGFVRVLPSTRVSGSVSVGSFSQDERLLPFTINSALTPEYAGALSSPAATANAKANIGSVNFSLSSRIIKNIQLTAGYRYYDFANKTRELVLEEGYARLDQVWEDVPLRVEPFSFNQSRLFAKVTFNLLKNASFNLGYSFSGIDRSEPVREAGGEQGEEERDKTTEGTFKASVDTHLADWLLIRASYLNAKRDWSLEGKKDIYVPGFRFKRYFQADRDRDAVNLLFDFSPVEDLGLTLSYLLGKDKYPNSDYGLRNSDFSSYAVDLSYGLGGGVAVYGFYGRENYESVQSSRRSGAVFSADPADDWTAELKDKVDTYGGGFVTPLLKGKWDLDVSYTFSRTKGTSALSSPPGGLPDLAQNFDKDLDTTTLRILKAKLLWKLRRGFAVSLGYWYEQYELEDITRNDWTADFLVQGQGMYLGALEPRYRYHVGFLEFIWNF
jgi:MtrB/PioB family decaheme-associated outer membrane protein